MSLVVVSMTAESVLLERRVESGDVQGERGRV